MKSKSKRRKRVAFVYTIDTIDDGLTRKKVRKYTDRILTTSCGKLFLFRRVLCLNDWSRFTTDNVL